MTGRRAVLAKAALTLVILGALLTQIRGADLVSRLAACDLRYVAAALALMAAGQILNAMRWRMLLRSVSTAPVPSLVDLTALVMAGMFMNLFLPSTVGGDLLRGELLRRRLGRRVQAYVSILMGRILALIAMLVLAAGALGLEWLRVGRVDTGTALIVAGFGCGAGLVLWTATSQRMSRLAMRLGSPRIKAIITEVRTGFAAYMASHGTLVQVFLLAIVANIIGVILPVALLASAIGLSVPPAFHFVAVPLITIVTLVPITVNGMGLREGAFAWLYASVGVPVTDAVALSLVFTAALVVLALVGGATLLLPRYSLLEAPSSDPNANDR